MGIRRKVKLNTNSYLAIDTETTGLYPFKGDMPFAISICDTDGNTYYAEFPVDPFSRHVTYDSRLDCIKRYVSDERIPKVFHNASFDKKMIERHMKIKVKGEINETVIAMRVFNNLEPTLELKPLAKKYLDMPDDDEKELQRATVKCRNRARKLNYNIHEKVAADYWLNKHFDPENRLCETYAVKDAERTMMLWLLLNDSMDELNVRGTYIEEMKVWPIFHEMECRGIHIYEDRLLKARKDTIKRKKEAEKKIYVLAGYKFNIRSNKQLSKVIYSRPNIIITKHNKDGSGSTNWKALRLYVNDEMVKALADYKVCEKSLTSYFDKYIDIKCRDKVIKSGYCLHTSVHQAAAVHGRISMKDPALQTVSIRRSKLGAEPPPVREPFGPRPGYLWLDMDQSQVELRVFADVSQEPVMLRAISEGRDLHSETANKAWGGKGNEVAIINAIASLELNNTNPSSEKLFKTWKEFGWDRTAVNGRIEQLKRNIAEAWLKKFNYEIVTAEESIDKKSTRARAKEVNFAKIYGGGAGAVMDLLFVDRETAQIFLRDYDKAFPRIVEFQHELTREARERGHIRSLLGRLLRIDPYEPYKAIDYLVSGSCADYMKLCIYRIHKYLRKYGYDAHIVLQVHDNIIVEVSLKEDWVKIAKNIKRILEDHKGIFGVPLPVETNICRSSWTDKESLEI